jgi:hypothetical protein
MRDLRDLIDRILRWRRQPRLSSLIIQLAEGSPTRRAGAAIAMALADRAAWEVAPPLCLALHDPDPGVRAAAVEALGYVGARETLAPLEKLLEDPDPAVRALAADARQRIDRPRRTDRRIEPRIPVELPVSYRRAEAPAGTLERGVVLDLGRHGLFLSPAGRALERGERLRIELDRPEPSPRDARVVRSGRARGRRGHGCALLPPPDRPALQLH